MFKFIIFYLFNFIFYLAFFKGSSLCKTDKERELENLEQMEYLENIKKG